MEWCWHYMIHSKPSIDLHLVRHNEEVTSRKEMKIMLKVWRSYNHKMSYEQRPPTLPVWCTGWLGVFIYSEPLPIPQMILYFQLSYWHEYL